MQANNAVAYTVQRTVRTLELLAQRKTITAPELARYLNVSPPTARRLLRSLAEVGYALGPLGDSKRAAHWRPNPAVELDSVRAVLHDPHRPDRAQGS